MWLVDVAMKRSLKRKSKRCSNVKAHDGALSGDCAGYVEDMEDDGE